MHWATLVSAQDLAAHLGKPGLVLVDCRHALSDVDAGEAAWARGHLPSAGHAHLERDLSRPGPASEGRHPMPTEAQFAALLGRLGITPGDQVVAYDEDSGAMAAARFWCRFSTNVSVLRVCRSMRACLCASARRSRSSSRPRSARGRHTASADRWTSTFC